MSQNTHSFMGTTPIKPLLLSMSAPVMLSMLISAIYNLVDSIYVAQVSDLDFLALSYAYPIQLLMIAFCTGTGIGFSAIFSKKLGEGDKKTANLVAFHGFFLYGCCWLLFLVFGLVGTPVFFHFSTSDPVVMDAGIRYLTVCCIGSVGLCTQFICERILQATGHPAGFMIVQGSGALLNIVLDPLFIFHFDMGVTGAAVATVIGQICGGLIGLTLLYRIRAQFPLSIQGVRIHWSFLHEIMEISIPAIVMQSLSSFMSLGLNQLLTLWSNTAVFVLGVYFKIQSFIFMPAFGISSGLIPIIGYHVGAKNPHRIRSVIRFGLQLAIGMGVFGMVLLFLFAPFLLKICFHATAQTLDMGIFALRLASLSFPLAAISVIFSSVFQALGRGVLSLILSLFRQLLFLLPFAAILLLLAPNWVWLCFLLAELCTAIITLICNRRILKPLLNTIA